MVDLPVAQVFFAAALGMLLIYLPSHYLFRKKQNEPVK
jgi:hypothetical protein